MRNGYLTGSDGVDRFGRSIGRSSVSMFAPDPVIFIFACPTRSYLERYQLCKTADEVAAAQENIIRELEQDYENSRRDKGR